MKKGILLSILLCITICCYAQDDKSDWSGTSYSYTPKDKFNWSGTYAVSDALKSGAIASGIAPYYDYTLKVKKGVDKYQCNLSLNGFQLFAEIKAEAVQRDNYLIIRFVESLDGSDLGYHDTTECILILEKKKDAIITKFASFHSRDDWGGKEPLFELTTF